MKMDDLGGKNPIFGVTSISRLFSSRHPGLTSGSVFKESPNMPKKKTPQLRFGGHGRLQGIRISFWSKTMPGVNLEIQKNFAKYRVF